MTSESMFYEGPTSRAEAIATGAVRYFSGDPCPKWHIADRYTLNGVCVECQRAFSRVNRKAAKDMRAHEGPTDQ